MAGIAAYYCVKNEERYLAESLASVAKAVDSIAVFDDNSTDATPAIIRACPKVEIYIKSPWATTHLARNRALALKTLLEKVRPEWVLVMDGDEVLGRPGEIRRLASLPGEHNSLRSRLLYFWDSRESVRVDGFFGKCFPLKLFRVDGQFEEITSAIERWPNGGQGSLGLHEGYMPTAFMTRDWKPFPGEIFTVLHYGYLLAEDRRRKRAFYNAADDSSLNRSKSRYDDILSPPQLEKWPSTTS